MNAYFGTLNPRTAAMRNRLLSAQSCQGDGGLTTAEFTCQGDGGLTTAEFMKGEG